MFEVISNGEISSCSFVFYVTIFTFYHFCYFVFPVGMVG